MVVYVVIIEEELGDSFITVFLHRDAAIRDAEKYAKENCDMHEGILVLNTADTEYHAEYTQDGLSISVVSKEVL